MPVDPVELLLKRVTAGGAWPPRSEAPVWRRIRKWRAFADNDRTELARIAGFDTTRGRRYRIDPLGDRIRQGWADHLFADELEVTPAEPADKELLDAVVEENDLTAECHAAMADLVVPEGQAWWRINLDTDLGDLPLLEWHSRLSVAPLFLGRRLKAVALLSILDGPGAGGGRASIYRHMEIHADGLVEHILFRGTKSRLGATVPLTDHPELESLAGVVGDGTGDEGARWEHGLPMLMGWIVNRRGRRAGDAASEFESIEDQLLDLNEAASIAATNVRLTARRRVVVPSSAVNAAPPTTGPGSLDVVADGEGGFVRADGLPMSGAVFDAGEDVLVADPVNEEMGREGAAPFKVLEYSFDAEPLIAHKRDLVETALTRLGLTPSWVGVRVDNDGYAASGTSLRMRLIPTDKAGRGKGRQWDTRLPHILCLMQRASALDVGEGGLGLPWAAPEDPPAVKRADPLPADPVEDAQVEQALVGAGVRSRETSIRAQHPEWDDGQIADELERLDADRPSAAAALGGFGA